VTSPYTSGYINTMQCVKLNFQLDKRILTGSFRSWGNFGLFPGYQIDIWCDCKPSSSLSSSSRKWIMNMCSTNEQISEAVAEYSTDAKCQINLKTQQCYSTGQLNKKIDCLVRNATEIQLCHGSFNRNTGFSLHYLAANIITKRMTFKHLQQRTKDRTTSIAIPQPSMMHTVPLDIWLRLLFCQ
jgi:hypothetical protein